jgi:hypothetical protein
VFASEFHDSLAACEGERDSGRVLVGRDAVQEFRTLPLIGELRQRLLEGVDAEALVVHRDGNLLSAERFNCAHAPGEVRAFDEDNVTFVEKRFAHEADAVRRARDDHHLVDAYRDPFEPARALREGFAQGPRAEGPVVFQGFLLLPVNDRARRFQEDFAGKRGDVREPAGEGDDRPRVGRCRRPNGRPEYARPVAHDLFEMLLVPVRRFCHSRSLPVRVRTV